MPHDAEGSASQLASFADLEPAKLRSMVTEGHSWSSPLLAADLWQNVPDSSMAVLGTGNISIFPLLETLTRLPWAPSTAVVICEAFGVDGEPAPTPRSALSRVLAAVGDLGFQLEVGTELEFFVFEADGHSRPPFGMNEWFTSQAVSKVGAFVEDLHRYLPEMGLPLYEVFNEHAAGQMEINMSPGFGMSALDRFVLMKLAIKEIARNHGLHASMMVKPSNDPECVPSGLHVHQVLHQEGHNAFRAPENQEAVFSECATQYIAGQLEHAPAITAFAASTVNAYKRYRPGTWAPVRAGWGIDNRTAMVRGIVAADNTRIENRIGASDSSGYLLVAAQVAAGLDGVRRRLIAREPASHNLIEDDAYTKVPMNLLDAVRELEKDAVLREAMGQEFCGHFMAVQRLVWERYQDHVSDWEIREYSEVI
jgi:glutamine synthetase